MNLLSEPFASNLRMDQAVFHRRKRGIPVLAFVRMLTASIERQYEGRSSLYITTEKILPSIRYWYGAALAK